MACVDCASFVQHGKHIVLSLPSDVGSGTPREVTTARRLFTMVALRELDDQARCKDTIDVRFLQNEWRRRRSSSFKKEPRLNNFFVASVGRAPLGIYDQKAHVCEVIDDAQVSSPGPDGIRHVWLDNVPCMLLEKGSNFFHSAVFVSVILVRGTRSWTWRCLEFLHAMPLQFT